MIRLSATTSRPWFLPLFLLLAVPASSARAELVKDTPAAGAAPSTALAPAPTAPPVARPTAAGPADAAAQVIRPADNLVVEGVPAIPKALAEKLQRYTEFRAASFSSWHPRRREMLINTRFADTPQIHRVAFPGGARTQLTFFSDRVGGAKYPPVATASDFFVFSKDIGGGEWFQLYRYDEKTGDTTLLTDGKSRNTGAVFSPKGDLIAYTSTRRTGQDNDLWIMDPRDPRTDHLVLTLQGGGWGALDFSPDQNQLLLGEEVSANESYVWLVDLPSRSKFLLTPRGGDKVSYEGATFSRDKKGVYVTTDKDAEFHRLAYVDLKTGAMTFLTTEIPWNVESFDLSADGKSLAFVTNENGISRVYVLSTATKKYRQLSQIPVGVIGGVQFHSNGVDLGFAMSSARANSDAYSINVQTGKLERWTTSETGGLDTTQFVEPQLVTWRSFDGRQISGFLYQPSPARFPGRRPVIVNIHGGPEAQSRPHFMGRLNFYLNELGVAVIFPNIRGSSGYGKTFLKLDDGFNREHSYADAEALYKWIQGQPMLDGERILVTGGSYGGHMTLVAATHHAQYIRAALAIVGMSNLVTFLERTEGYRRDLRRVEYGDERDPKMREFLLRIAPLNRAADVRKPLFVVQGLNDPRVPASEAEQMVRTVRGQGVPVWYLLAKDEGHGFAKKKNQDFLFYSSILFIQQFLLN
ncbi:prolyl oligopeptidase family serine peptidase [Haliangium sp. UPWRP_2]|uniref:S9 family peptidase n=1 Tax=Haliangium sp. UPWRP_2 TaxID=1931276 RepID=UPI0018ED3FD4|nr:prolyl oligopeptidase family serine peptidase [Haliangium sp. UPWRP_2]